MNKCISAWPVSWSKVYLLFCHHTWTIMSLPAARYRSEQHLSGAPLPPDASSGLYSLVPLYTLLYLVIIGSSVIEMRKLPYEATAPHGASSSGWFNLVPSYVHLYFDLARNAIEVSELLWRAGTTWYSRSHQLRIDVFTEDRRGPQCGGRKGHKYFYSKIFLYFWRFLLWFGHTETKRWSAPFIFIWNSNNFSRKLHCCWTDRISLELFCRTEIITLE